jgi:hypothetical protein
MCLVCGQEWEAELRRPTILRRRRGDSAPPVGGCPTPHPWIKGLGSGMM